jgi:DNA-binding PadR family transcriptional regulator
MISFDKEIIGQLPLTEATFYIMISLVKPRHGYAIMQNTKILSRNRVHLGPGTLYGALNTLMNKRWIVQWDHRTSLRRKTYILTPLGRQVLEAEIIRLREMAEQGNESLIKGNEGEQ